MHIAVAPWLPPMPGPGISDAQFDLMVLYLLATLHGVGIAAESIAAIGETLSPPWHEWFDAANAWEKQVLP
jgi:hypothetical protein